MNRRTLHSFMLTDFEKKVCNEMLDTNGMRFSIDLILLCIRRHTAY